MRKPRSATETIAKTRLLIGKHRTNQASLKEQRSLSDNRTENGPHAVDLRGTG
jgi:hypothetical protein